MIHHRTPEFSKELVEALRLLQPLFGTREPVLPVHTTGRGAMEAVLCNLFSHGDEIAVCCNGKFGELWAKFASSYGLVVHRVAEDWATDIDTAQLKDVLSRYPRTRAVALAYCDTSTGVRNDVPAVARAAKQLGALVLVDCVSALGGMPFAFDEWEVDAAVTASQKCLMSAPGLAWVVVSERAWAACETSKLPRNYWDFIAIRRSVTKPRPETPGTPPVAIVLQVAEALRMIHEEGLDAVYARHAALAERVRRGVDALGLSLQCPRLPRLSATMTAIALPAGVDPRAFRDRVKARGILTAGGLGPFENAGFRIGHMGDIRIADVERTLDAVSIALDEVGAGARDRPARPVSAMAP
jgi:aspartate aminotransferase-like enzyme